MQMIQNVASGDCTKPLLKQRQVSYLLAMSRQRSEEKEKELEIRFLDLLRDVHYVGQGR